MGSFLKRGRGGKESIRGNWVTPQTHTGAVDWDGRCRCPRLPTGQSLAQTNRFDPLDDIRTTYPETQQNTELLHKKKRNLGRAQKGYSINMLYTHAGYLRKHNSRSLGWSSGNPRMLLLVVLVLEFESRRGEILKLFAKIKKKDKKLLRAPSVGRYTSTRVDEGRKS